MEHRIPAQQQALDVGCNFMKTYKVRVISQTNSIVLGLILITILFVSIFLLFPNGLNQLISILGAVVSMTIAHLLWRKLATAKTEWILFDDCLQIKWISQYFGATNDDIDIKLVEISKYKDVYGRGYNLFKIYLTDGSVFRFGHGALFIKDEFGKFYTLFQELYIKEKHPDQWAKYYGRKFK